MEISKTIRLKCDSAKLWEWLTDFEKLKQWNPTMLEQKVLSEGEPKKGHKSQILMREGKKELWYEDELMEYEPNSHLSISLKGGSLGNSPMSISYKLSPDGDYVDLLYRCLYEPPRLLHKLMQPIMSIMVKKDMKKTFALLKEKVESKT